MITVTEQELHQAYDRGAEQGRKGKGPEHNKEKNLALRIAYRLGWSEWFSQK